MGKSMKSLKMKKVDMPSKKGLGWIITAVVLLAMAACLRLFMTGFFEQKNGSAFIKRVI